MLCFGFALHPPGTSAPLSDRVGEAEVPGGGGAKPKHNFLNHKNPTDHEKPHFTPLLPRYAGI